MKPTGEVWPKLVHTASGRLADPDNGEEHKASGRLADPDKSSPSLRGDKASGRHEDLDSGGGGAGDKASLDQVEVGDKASGRPEDLDYTSGTHQIVKHEPGGTSPEDVFRLWLDGRSPNTLRAYTKDLQAFGLWLSGEVGHELRGDEALYWLLDQPGHAAQATALGWMKSMTHLAPNTRNRRLSTLRSVTKVARMLGTTMWEIEIPGAKTELRRDVSGPTEDQVRTIFDEARKGSSPIRDRALLCVALTLGLRLNEIASAVLEDYDPERRVLRGVGKGQKLFKLKVPARVSTALDAWLDVREAYEDDWRIFQLSDSGVYYIIRELGKRAGISLRPHGLRHASVTAALDATGGDVRSVQKFSRHSKVETVLAYDDARGDTAGEVAEAVSDRIIPDP